MGDMAGYLLENDRWINDSHWASEPEDGDGLPKTWKVCRNCGEEWLEWVMNPDGRWVLGRSRQWPDYKDVIHACKVTPYEKFNRRVMEEQR